MSPIESEPVRVVSPAPGVPQEDQVSPPEEGIEEPEEPPGEEQKKVLVPRAPSQPTAAEIAEHAASGHVSHRSWCIHCVRARKAVQPHYQVDRAGGDGLPTLHMDYFYLSSADAEEEDVMPHLVVRCDKTRRTWATALPQKGTHVFNISWLCSIVREAGWKKMILFSDNEPAMKALKQAVVEAMKDLELTLQESPTSAGHENAPSNGTAESAVREVKRMIRAILSELESNMGQKLNVDHHMLAWVARHAAFLITRFRIGEDGKTAYQRALGREWRRPTIVFGEQILFKAVGAEGHKRKSPLEPRVTMGRYVGTASRNADLLVMTPTGVVKGHSLHRRAELDRWSTERFEELRGLPWKMSNPVERAPQNRVDMPALEGEQPKGEEKEFKPRHLYVLKSDTEKFGYTPCCPGCIAQIAETAARSHNDECRLRIQRKLMETEEGQARVKRAQERVEADYGRKAKRPALEGRPPPDVPEVAASEAAGAPLARPAELTEGMAPEPGRQQGRKRKGEDLEDLYMSEAAQARPIDEPQVISQQGGSSGSGGARPAPAAVQEEPAQADVEIAEPEATSAGSIEKIFQNHGVKCSRREAETLSNLVASLGVDQRSPSVMNDGLWLNMEEKGWKLQTDREAEAMFQALEQNKPLLVTGLPSNGAFVDLQRSQNDLQKISREDAKRQIACKRKCMRACIDAYRQQIHEKRYFLQECPRGTKDFGTSQYSNLSDDTFVVDGPTCVWTVDESGGRLAGTKIKKRTRRVTNSAPVAKASKVICKGDDTKTWKRKLQFKEGTVRVPTDYPPKLVDAIARGIRAQLVPDGQIKEIGHVGGPDPHEEANFEEHHHETLPKAEGLYVKEPVIDANTGVELDPIKVAEARATELAWIKKQDVYQQVPTSMCYEETGGPPITLKWVDRNKGDSTKENFRSRLVVREVKSQGQAAMIPEFALFSSMPPLEALKLMCSLLATLRVSRGGGKLTLTLSLRN